MDNFSASEVSIKPLQNTFLIDLEGHSVIALKLASKVAKQISGQENSSGGIISKLKTKLGLTSETERWFVVTSLNNPLLEEIWFGALVADRLTKATGTSITESELTISPAAGVREKDDRFNSVEDAQEKSVAQSLVD